jgi:hypothetical protein
LYQKGEALLHYPTVGLDGFLDEAFMCFFRCLEYLTLVKTLAVSGSFDEKKFAKAWEKLKLKPGDPKHDARWLGGQLVAQRGSCAAHLGKKTLRDLTPQNVFDLKKIVDITLRELVRQTPLAVR